MTDADKAEMLEELAEPEAPQPPDHPEKAMAIFAHPDDADFLCAGTMAKWVKQGTEVILVVITDGSKGSEDPDLTRDRLIKMRMEEQRAAAKRLGVEQVYFLGFEDGTLYDTIPLRRELSRLIRQHKPDAVLCGDPTSRFGGNRYINHPDHVAAANSALAAVSIFARNRPSFPDLIALGLEPHTVKHVYVCSPDVPDYWVDITETIDQKVAALQQHMSQVPADEVGKWIREWGRREGKPHGYEYAESFRYLNPG